MENIRDVDKPEELVDKVCILCKKPMDDYDDVNNNCCDECWLEN